MPNIYELPPSTGTGDAEQQLRELRNFLFRMVRQLNAASETTKGEIVSAGRNGIVLAPNGNENNGSKPNDQTIELVRKQGSTLRALITKTADEVRSYMDVITAQLKSEYVAVSDFGEYTETVNTTIEQTAKATIESYNYDAMLQELSDGLDAIGTYVTNIRGEIRRGFIEVDGELFFGIAISDRLNFTGTVREEQGISYYEISDYQSFGLYTARGWMFFLNGVKVGWFDSQDGMLHVANIMIEDTLRMGDWLISTVGGWGIRYVGG